MNGVQFTVLIPITIILSLTLTIRSQYIWTPQPKKVIGPGISSCNYYGYMNDECSNIQIPIDNLPEECTSIFWDGLTVEKDYSVVFWYNFGDDKGVLDELLSYNKPVYVYYGQPSQKVWTQVFGCDGSNAVDNINHNMEGLKAYMDAHPGITGLILTYLELDENSPECTGYTDHLVTYINAMREMFPDLEIGIELVGTFLLDYYAAPKMEWLDFNVLDDYLDFYIVYVCRLNDCEFKFKVGGSSPVTGNAPYTLTKIQECLDIMNVPSEKAYYDIQLSGTSEDTEYHGASCGSYQEICTKSRETIHYCTDTTQSYFEKGQFIKQNAAGFVGTDIDFADPNNVCDCTRPFEPFYDILDGFNGSPAPKSCIFMDYRLLK